MSRNSDDSSTPSDVISAIKDFYVPNERFEQLANSQMEYESVDQADQRFFYCEDFRMYGTSEKLKKNVIFFRNFSSNYKRLFIMSAEACNRKPIFLKSFKRKQYLCKTDILVYFENTFIQLKELDKISNLVFRVAIFCLRHYEEVLDNCLEFVECTIEEIEKFFPISELMDNVELVALDKKHSKPASRSCKSWGEFLKQVTSFVPFDMTEDESEYIDYFLYKQWNIGQFQSYPESALKNVRVVEEVVKYIGQKIESKPEWFKPNCQKNCISTAIVRIFEDHGQKFVILPELLKATEAAKMDIDLNIFQEFGGSSEEIPTVDFKDISDIIGKENMMKTEFLITPILRAKHAAVSIPTHDGEHCILAVDALLELLRNLIHSKKLFQRAREEDWDLVEQFIDEVTAYFNGEDVSTFFMNKKRDEELKKEMTDEFLKLDLPKDFNKIRDVECKGFTAKDLQNELEYLKITRLFPNIAEHAERVYDKLLEYKFENRLTTANMFDAVESCILMCLFDKFPKLKQFLHSQKSCYRVLNTICSECKIVRNKKSTRWKEYTIFDVVNLEINASDTTKDPFLEFSDGLELQTSNTGWKDPLLKEKKKNRKGSKVSDHSVERFDILKFGCFEEKEKHKYLTDYTEKEEMKKYISAYGPMDWVSKQRDKKIYIRTILSTKMNYEENKRVLIEEVIYAITFLLKKQGIHTKENEGKYKTLCHKWARKDTETVFRTISLPELKIILEEFDIDKTDVTLIPDPVNCLFIKSKNTRILQESMFFINSSCGTLTNVSQICYTVFEHLVFKHDFGSVDNCGHKTPLRKCLCGMKQEIIAFFKRSMANNENSYMPVNYLTHWIESMKRIFITIGCKPTSMVYPTEGVYKEMVRMSILLDDKILHLSPGKFCSKRANQEARKIEVENWRIKTALTIISCTVFFGSEYPELYSTIIKSITFKIPFINLKNQDDLESLLTYGESFEKMTKEEIKKNYDEFKIRKDNNQLMTTAEDVFLYCFENIKNGTVMKKIKGVKDTILSNKEGIKKETSNSMSSSATDELGSTRESPPAMVESEKKEKKQSKNGEDFGTIQQDSTEKSGGKQVEWCTKCFRTSQHCKKIEEKHRLEKSEKKILKNKLEEIEKELAKMKERENKIEEIFKKKFDEEIETIKKKTEEETLESSKVIVRMMKSDNTRLKDSLSHTEKKLKESELTLEKMTQEVHDSKTRYEENMRRVEREALASSREIEEMMRAENQKLKEQIALLKLTDRADIFSQNSLPTASSCSSSSCSSPSLPAVTKTVTSITEVLPSNTTSSSSDTKQLLNELRQRRNSFRGKRSIGRASDYLRRVRNVSDKVSSDRAGLEFQKFKMDHASFLKAINRNISLLESHRNIRREQLTPLPEEPKFSQWFMNKYNEIMNTRNNGSNTPSTSNSRPTIQISNIVTSTIPTKTTNESLPLNWVKAKTPTSSSNVPNTSNACQVERRPPAELDDQSCVICTDEMITHVGTQKCFSCRRRYHDHCIVGWLNTNRICPMCRDPMLDPNEFPALS